MKDSKIDPRTGTTRNNETLNAQNTLLSAVTPMITEIYSDTGRTTGAVRPGSAIDDAMPRFTGSAAPGSLVAVYSRGIKLGEGYANDQGIFSFVTTTPFADGEQFITLQATQADGEVAYSDFFILHYRAIKHPVDADQPVDQEPLLSKPVIEGAYDNRNGEVLIENRFTEDTTPLLKGTADPLAIVYITNILNDVLGSVQANNDGKWELEIEAIYAGPFKAIAVDAQNPASVSYASETIDVWVGTEPPPRPSAPVIESAFDNVDSTGNVSNNGITDDARPRFSGKAVPGSLVKIYSVHTREVLGEGYADENGNFSFETTADLQLGLNKLYATSTVNGMESGVSNLFDIQYVNAPYIPEPFVPPYASAANVDEPFADNIGNGATTPDFTPTLIGKANVNATVIIRLNGNVIGEVQANYDGSWHYDVKTPLEPGENVFTFAGINDGEEQISEQSFTLNIALSARINYAEDDVGEQTDNLYTGYFTDDSQPTLRGVGTPNGMVKIYTEKGLLGSAQINEKGEWHFTPDVALLPGLHTFHPVVEYPGMATPVTGEEFMLEIAIPPSLTPEIWSVYDNQGDHSIVENGASTDDATPTFSGSAYGRGMTIVVRDNGKAIGQTEVNSNGEWTWTPETALEAGSYSLTFEVVDNKGNVHASEPFIFDVVTPVVTQILYADDNVGDITDALHSGDRTDDETPTLHGSSSPNSLVNIYYQGYYYLGSAKSNANGEWRFTPSHDLPAGTHDFFAREVNEYGSELAPGPNFTLEIVPVVPPIEYFAPTVDAAYDNKELHNHLRNGDITDDTTPRFSGNGMPNSIIEVYDHGEKIADAKVDGQGNWSWTPGSALPTGDHRFSFVTVGEDGSHYASDDFNLEIINQVAGRIISAEDNVGDVTDPLTSGSRTDDTTPTLNGVGTPNGTVDIYNGYRYLGSAEINADGEWSFTPYELDEGVYHFHATVTGPDGTVLAQSPAFDLTIAKPVEYFAPTVGEVYDYVGWHKALENGDYTDDTAPDFHGGGMPGSTIQVYVDGKPAGEVKVNDWGYWNFKPNTALEPGSHTFRFVTLGEDGKEYASEAFNLQVISHTPGRIDLAEDNAGDVTDPLSSGARTDDTTPTLKGVGTPNGIVTIWDNWNPIGSVKINANGEWSFTPSRDLPEGSHSFNAVVTGPDGTTLDASPDFKLDIQLPAPPIEYFAPTVTSVYDDERHQTTVRNGGLTDDTTPHFSGRGMPDSIIDVHLDGEKIGEASVNYMGYWSFMPDTALEPGNHRFSFVTVGADGQQYASDDFNLEVITQVAGRIDFAEDNVGDITDPLTSGARTDDTTPTLHGVGTPGGIVTVYYGNWNTFGSAKINADGTWSITPTRALSAGEHNFFASVTGPDGTTLESSPIFTLDIAPFVPPIEYFAPTITNVYDDEGRHNYLSSGDSTDDTTPRFSGRGMPGSTIEVRLNGEKIGEASVTWLGYWEFTSDTALEPGNHRFSFVTVGADGQEYASDDFNLEVISHVAGRIDFAEDNVGAATDPLTSGSRTDDTTPTLKGVGSPNGTVEIHNGYRYLGSAKINADGEWSFTPDALQDGSYSFRATVISPDGTRLAQTPAFDLIIEKPVDYYAPTVSDIEDNVGRNSVGSRGGMTDDTTPTFSGRAVAGSTLQVRIDGKTQYSVEVDEAGRWSWTPSPALQPGKHAFTFVSTDAAGNEFISDAIPLEIIAHVTGRIVSADDNVGEVTDALTSGSTTDDAQPTLRGVGTPGGSVEIFYDGKLMSYAEINDKGEWSYTPNSTLSNGSHEFYVVVTSPDGTTLPAGPTFSLIIDAPVVYFAPVINGVVDNVHSLAFLSDGDTTDDATPSFVGNGLADSTIAVYVNDQYYGEAKADPWGVWTYTPSPALEQGEHTFTFVSVDDQGTEYRSGAFTLNIEPAIPLTILFADDDIGAITDPLFSGSTTDDSQPTLRGTGMPGSIIEIFGTGGVFGSEKIDSDGNWSWTPDKPLPAGDYSFVGIMKDSYGFESERTDWFELTITAPEIDRSLTVRSLLQDADAPLFDEPQTELSTTQPVEPTAFVPASAPLVQEWESTTNHY